MLFRTGRYVVQIQRRMWRVRHHDDPVEGGAELRVDDVVCERDLTRRFEHLEAALGQRIDGETCVDRYRAASDVLCAAGVHAGTDRHRTFEQCRSAELIATLERDRELVARRTL